MSDKAFQRIGVVGAGVIGAGVAQLFAQAGHDVVLVDRGPAQLDAARAAIARDARLYGLIQRGLPERDAVLARLRFSDTVAALAEADFVIENITEDWEAKRALHARIEAAIGARIPVAANTSAIPITRIAGLYAEPERVVGMHFMNPPPVMPVVEVIRGARTGEAAFAAARALVAQAGKQAIVVNDAPGFVTNRVMMLMVNEAMFLVHEGVASVEDVDRLFKTCFGHKMGPLETADLIGLDTVLRSIEVIQDEFQDGKYRPCPLLKQKVYAGCLGRKSGAGFYNYSIGAR